MTTFIFEMTTSDGRKYKVFNYNLAEMLCNEVKNMGLEYQFTMIQRTQNDVTYSYGQSDNWN